MDVLLQSDCDSSNGRFKYLFSEIINEHKTVEPFKIKKGTLMDGLGSL